MGRVLKNLPMAFVSARFLLRKGEKKKPRAGEGKGLF
jgi:hypothetical protein